MSKMCCFIVSFDLIGDTFPFEREVASNQMTVFGKGVLYTSVWERGGEYNRFMRFFSSNNACAC